MILQQLVKDAERIVGTLPPPMYDMKPVRWILDLDANGQLLGVVQTSGGGKKDRGLSRLAPFTVRTSGVKALLLCDTPTYTLGISFDDARATEKHADFRQMVERCAAATGHPGVQAVARFLNAWDATEPSGDRLGVVMEKSDWVTFRVDGVLPVDDPAVRAFWPMACGDAESPVGDTAECVACGRQAVIPENLPVLIKRVPGGQSSGIALVSINADAFESYALPRATTSRVCSDCGERFGKALNHLLAAEDGHLAIGPLVYVFWTRHGGGFSWASLLQQPQASMVRELLASYRTGKPYTAADADDFYATALTASGGRAVVRDWLHATVGEAATHLARWFTRIRQVNANGETGEPLGIYRLAASLYRDANKEMVAQVPRVLVRAALHGGPLPTWLLAQAVNRCRAEQRVTYPRAALMKAVLQSQSSEKEEYMTQLEPSDQRPAYRCGRLLAVLEAVQRAAQGKINTTLVDRFYGAASTAPATVFGNLLGDAQPHLAKLRKTRPATHHALQQRLEDVLNGLASFPHTLSLQDQALFSLGYYHQRAQDRAEAIARKVAGDAALTDIIDTEEESHE